MIRNGFKVEWLIVSALMLLTSAGEAEAPDLTPGPTVSLSEALAAVERHNLELSAARLEIDKAKGTLKKAWGMLLPVAQVTLDYTLMDHEDRLDLSDSLTPLLDSFPITIPQEAMPAPLLVTPKHRMVGAAQLYVPLIHPEGWLTVKSARSGVDLAQAAIEQARHQLLMGTAQAYLLALSSLDLIYFYHAQRQTAAEQLRVCESRHRNGTGLRVDVVRAQTDVEQAEQSLLSATLAFDNVRDTLSQLTGIDGLPMPIRDTFLEEPATETAETMEHRVFERADVKQAQNAIRLAEYQLKTAKMTFLPVLSGVLQGSREFMEMPELGSDDRTRFAAMLSLVVPLYNHARYGELDRSRAHLKQAKLKRENLVTKAGVAVRRAERDYRAANHQIDIASRQVELAEEGLRLVEAAYRSGAGDSLAVTNARQTHTAAGFNLAMKRLQAQLALLTLMDAIGDTPTITTSTEE